MPEPYFSDDDPWRPEDDEPHVVKVWEVESVGEHAFRWTVLDARKSQGVCEGCTVGAVFAELARVVGECRQRIRG